MTTREKAHRLLDELPESEIEPVLDFIASRGGDPLLQLLDRASEEDEEVSAEEEAAAAEGRADVAAGLTVCHEEMVRKYG